jgi:DNA-binding transcriptional LysR family regulator
MGDIMGAACAGSQHPSGVERPPLVVPDLRQLRAFVAVAEDLNFTHAAARLHLGQQAVSKSVAQLERELGVALLTRTSRAVRLTAAGEALLADARELLAAADRAFARAREHGEGIAGSLVVGATPAVGPAVLNELARALSDGAPELSIALNQVRPGDTVALLRDGRADVVLSRGASPADEIVLTALAPTPAELLVPAGHRLGGRASVPLRELDGERLLTWNPPGTPYTDLLVGLCAAAAATVTPVESTITGGGGLVELVPLNAVAIVPEGWPASAGTERVSLDGVELPLVAAHAAGTPAPAVRRLLEALR